MTGNPDGTLSLDQAVEKMMGATPEPADETVETVEPEGTDAGEPEVETAEAEVETEEQGEPEAEPEFEVDTVDGKRKLTLSQLKEGAMLKADYTRKTMALAEDRKTIEAEKSEVSQLKAQLAEALQVWAIPAEQEPDWVELAQKLDPQKFNAARAQWDNRKRQAETAREAFRALQERQRQESAQLEQSRLLDAVPEWRDPVVFKAAAQEIVDTGNTYGFKPEEIAAVVDHRMLLVLRDAAAYRKIKDAKPEVAKKVAQTAVTMKPGAKPTKTAAEAEARQKAHARLKQTGKIEDALALLFR